MAPHSSTLAWKIPWTEEPDRLQSMGLLGVGHDWATSLSLFTFVHWRRKWQPTPVFLPGESQGREAWLAAVYGVAQSRTRLKWRSSSSSSGQESVRKKWSSHHSQQKSLKCSTWMQFQKWQNDLSSFPRQTIQHHSNLSLCLLKDDAVKVLHSLCQQICKLRLEKVSFHSNPKERQCQRMFKLPHDCTQMLAR